MTKYKSNGFIDTKSEKDSVLAIRSKSALVEALFSLMERDLYKELTISQICQEAEIARQTFYHHFTTKRDILNYYFHSCFLDETQKHPDTGDAEKNLRHLFEEFPIPKNRLRLLQEQDIMYILTESMRDFLQYSVHVYQFTPMMGNPAYDLYQKELIVSTLQTILSCWIVRDFKETPEELVKLATLMLKHRE